MSDGSIALAWYGSLSSRGRQPRAALVKTQQYASFATRSSGLVPSGAACAGDGDVVSGQEVGRVGLGRRPPKPPQIRKCGARNSCRQTPSIRLAGACSRGFGASSVGRVVPCPSSHAVNKEGHYASTPKHHCHPPRPISRVRLLVPGRFWVTLTIESGERILGTLSRIVAQQLTPPSGVQEASHKRS
jgi:hypothetical protein